MAETDAQDFVRSCDTPLLDAADVPARKQVKVYAYRIPNRDRVKELGDTPPITLRCTGRRRGVQPPMPESAKQFTVHGTAQVSAGCARPAALVPI